MDHKTLFTYHGHQTPNDCTELTLEEIYQAFKQRLIEEVCVPTGETVIGYSGPQERQLRLIDTTERENG